MKTNKRSLKTQENIEKVFVDLLEKKSVDEISITEITQLADLNRRTFYIHYKDIYDLQDQTEKKALQAFSDMVESYEPNQKSIDYFQHILTYVFENIKELEILCRNKNSSLMSNLLKLTIKRGAEVLPFKNNEGIYILSYTCWGMIGFLHAIVMTKDEFNHDDIMMMTTLISNSIQPYLKEE